MFTLVCLTLSAIQDVFGCEEPLLMKGSNKAHGWKSSEALLLTNQDVPGPEALEGPDVRGS